MKTIARILTVAILATTATLSFAQPAPMGGPPRNPENMLKKLGLTDDQAKQVKDIMDQEREFAVQQRAQLKVISAQIEQAMVATPIDLKAVNALVDKKTQLQGENQKHFYATASEIQKIVGDKIFAQLSQHFRRNHRVGNKSRMNGNGWNHQWSFKSGQAPQPANP